MLYANTREQGQKLQIIAGEGTVHQLENTQPPANPTIHFDIRL